MTCHKTPDSVEHSLSDARGKRPQLAVGIALPCHAFTDKVLLLARGEVIATPAQLERLLRDDVVFSDNPPERFLEAIRHRQAGPHAAEGIGVVAQPAPTASVKRASFAQELPTAYNIRGEAVRHMAGLVEQVRSGQRPDLDPMSATVRNVVASVQRSKAALTSLMRLKTADTYTYTHSINTCIMSAVLALHSGLASLAEPIALGALVHDIGKLRLPEELLQSPSELSESEWGLMRQHPMIGLEIVAGWPGLTEPAIQAIGQHHERLDGSGYPYGLSGADISSPGRLLGIVDVYDGMTSERPYHRAIPAPEAMTWILRYTGTRFDPQLVRAFVDAIGMFPVGSLARLSTGELAVVLGVSPDALHSPVVLVVREVDGAPVAAPRLLDLARAAAMGEHREIVALEDPAAFAIDIDHCLTTGSEPGGLEGAHIDSSA